MHVFFRVARNSSSGRFRNARNPSSGRRFFSSAASAVAGKVLSPTKKVSKVESATWAWLDNWIIGEKLCPFAKPLRSRPGSCRVAVTDCDGLEELKLVFSSELDILEDKSGPETTLLALSSSSFLQEYFDFYRSVHHLDAILEERKLSKDIQIVLFHPEAIHNSYTCPDPGALRRRLVAHFGRSCPTIQKEAAESRGRRRGSKYKLNSHDISSVSRHDACIESPDENEEDQFGPNYVLRAPYPTFHLLREADVARAKTLYKGDASVIPRRNADQLYKTSLESDMRELWLKAVQHEE